MEASPSESISGRSTAGPWLTNVKPPRKRGTRARKAGRSGAINRLLENDLIRRVSYDEYRAKVKNVYGGPKGAMLATCSMLSLHIPLGERLFRTRRFDLRGMKSILDVGSGAGQIAKHLLKYSDPGAQVTCTDLSRQMLRRARNRLKSKVPTFVTADLSSLPFADAVVRRDHVRLCARALARSDEWGSRSWPAC